MGATQGQRGSYKKGRARREEILRAAEDAFATYGFRGVSMATIAQVVGISEQGVLHHFQSKELLLLEVLRARDVQNIEGVARFVEPSQNYLGALLALCRENAASPALVRLFTVLAAESIEPGNPGHEYFRTRYRGLRELATRYVIDEQGRGGIVPDLDAGSVAVQILAMFDGLQLQWLLDPDELAMSEVFADFLARLVPGAGHIR